MCKHGLHWIANCHYDRNHPKNFNTRLQSTHNNKRHEPAIANIMNKIKPFLINSLLTNGG